MPTPKLSALPTTPYGRYFRQLSTIETSEKTAIKVEKESLLQSRYSETNDQHPTVMPLIEDSSNKDTKEQNRLLQWLHRIRKKNKEGPPETPRK
ncbi:hypothetical protein RU95_GL000698 [Enterococcus avium]|nr:hypothetical protein RU95_GL000698 [Enterococcus avium]